MRLGVLDLMKVAQYVTMALGAIGFDITSQSSQQQYALGLPQSDAVDHVNP